MTRREQAVTDALRMVAEARADQIRRLLDDVRTGVPTTRGRNGAKDRADGGITMRGTA
jgi:hypothetical protein